MRSRSKLFELWLDRKRRARSSGVGNQRSRSRVNVRLDIGGPTRELAKPINDGKVPRRISITDSRWSAVIKILSCASGRADNSALDRAFLERSSPRPPGKSRTITTVNSCAWRKALMAYFLAPGNVRGSWNTIEKYGSCWTQRTASLTLDDMTRRSPKGLQSKRQGRLFSFGNFRLSTRWWASSLRRSNKKNIYIPRGP